MTVIPKRLDGLHQYHTGLVVPDVRETAARYSDLLGLRFASLRRSTMSVVVDGEPREAELLVTYSIDGPPYLELIEEQSGGVWGSDALGLSHVGFWAADLPDAVERMAAMVLPSRVHEVDSNGRLNRFSFHPGDGGLWLELVATLFQPQLMKWLESGVGLGTAP
jgi:catechol 2,3-dioxygenase-like lactoylglutathione lyase family enzyme